LVADVIGHIPLSWRPPCPDRQVGEVAPAPRRDVLTHVVTRGGESKGGQLAQQAKSKEACASPSGHGKHQRKNLAIPMPIKTEMQVPQWQTSRLFV